MQTPHDALFKYVFSQAEHAASALQAILPSELGARLDWGSLRLEPISVIDERLEALHSDLIFSVRCDGRDAFLYVLFEHQSTDDPLMAFRMLRYIVRIWDRYVSDSPNAKHLPAVIPVVLHHGQTPWSAPTELLDLQDLESETRSAIEPYLPRFRYLLDDLSLANEEGLRARSLTALSTAGLLLLQNARESLDLAADLARWLDVLAKVLAAPNGVAALAALLRYVLEVGDVGPEEVQRVLVQLGPKAAEAFMTGAQRLTQQVREQSLAEGKAEGRAEGKAEGRAEGKAEGRAEGKAEGKAELVLRQLTLRFGPLPASTSERIRATSAENLDVWADRVLTAQTLDDVLR